MAHPGQLRWGVPLGCHLRGDRVVGGHGPARDVRRRERPGGRVHDAGRARRPLLAFVAAGVLFCIALGFARRRGASCRSPSGASSSRSRSSRTTVTLFELGQALGTWKRSTSIGDVDARSGSATASGSSSSPRPSTSRAWALLAVGSVGDPLRRGLARDPRARRLDQPLVGAGRVVLEQARARHVDAGDRDGDARASTTSPTRCSSATAR